MPLFFLHLIDVGRQDFHHLSAHSTSLHDLVWAGCAVNLPGGSR
jgi:hypothetical protein